MIRHARLLQCPWQIQPAGTWTMSAEENKAVVRRYYDDLWNDGDLTVIQECIGPEGLAHFDGEEHVNRDL